MIPKSLLLALIAGVSGAGILGVYFESLNPQDIEYVQGSAISLLVEKRDFKMGETIPISIINSGTSQIVFSSDLPSLRIRALDGTVFFSANFDGVKLDPNEKYIYDWTQQKNDSSKISEGRYVVDSFGHDAEHREIADSVIINIIK